MKVVAINGSPRKDGNNEKCLEVMGKIFNDSGIDFEIVHSGCGINPCTACYHCWSTGDIHCVQDDGYNEILDKVLESDGVIFASPVYHGGISGNMKCLMDRMFLTAGHKMHHKVGAAICTLRRSGGLSTYQQLCQYMSCTEMVIVTSDYWNAIHGAEIGEVMEDTEGIEVIEKLARNMSWMLKVIDASKGKIDPPETHARTMTNFIR